ncbi:hypothetical protein [Endozoicomonas sp. 2B-B]
MNYQSTDVFAGGGGARGFGLVNSAIDAKENRQYRKQMMGMQKDLHDRKIRKEEMQDRAYVFQALQFLSTSDNPAVRQMAQDFIDQAGNGTFGDLLGEGKRFAGFQMVPAQEGQEPRVAIKLDADGYQQPAYLSQKRTSDPKDPYVTFSGPELVVFMFEHPRAGEFKNLAKAVICCRRTTAWMQELV